ncbi:MAG: hypothetical protein JO325_10365 [Solirubrobacterales bacterium]|nr:hypothetical protein [Solirubrobacterales bacterium]
MRDHDYRHPALGEPAHCVEHVTVQLGVEHVTDQLGVERRGRLVEQHQLRLHRERPRERHVLERGHVGELRDT